MDKTANGGDSYDIHREIDNLMAGIEIQRDYAPVPMRRRLRKHLAERMGDQWMKSVVSEHTLDGRQMWTISLICLQCGTIHSYIAVLENDVIRLATAAGEE